MVSALDFRSAGWWFDDYSLPSCCFSRQETLLHIVSLRPGVLNGYERHTAGGIHPEGVAILSVASCYTNQDKLQPCGPPWLMWDKH